DRRRPPGGLPPERPGAAGIAEVEALAAAVHGLRGGLRVDAHPADRVGDEGRVLRQGDGLHGDAAAGGGGSHLLPLAELPRAAGAAEVEAFAVPVDRLGGRAGVDRHPADGIGDPGTAGALGGVVHAVPTLLSGERTGAKNIPAFRGAGDILDPRCRTWNARRLPGGGSSPSSGASGTGAGRS